MKTFLRSLKYGKPYKRLIVAVSLMSFGAVFINLAYIYLIKKGVNNSFDGNFETVKRTIIISISLAVINSLISFVRSFLNNIVSERTLFDIQKDLFSHIVKLPMSFFRKESEGALIARITTDAKNMQVLITTITSGLVFQPFKVIVLIVAGFMLSFKLASLFFIAIPVVFLIIKTLGKKIRKYSSELNILRSKIYSFIEQRIYAIELVKSLTKEKEESSKFAQKTEKYIHKKIKMAKILMLSQPFSYMVMIVTFFAIIIFGIREVEAGVISPGSFAAFGAISISIFSFLGNIGRSYNTIQSALASSDRVFEVLDMDPEDDNGIRFKGLRDKISIEDLHFSYRKDEKVLEGLSFCIYPGEKILINGASGSGKTTLVKLFLKYYETSRGKISFDGVPLSNYKISSLREAINYLPQETLLFNDTIANNITYGCKAIPEINQIIESARLSCSLDFINTLEDGFNTVIGDRGTGLSQGEKQRLALARAILRGGNILILDEATSSIDEETEESILDNIITSSLFETIIIISHKKKFEQVVDRAFTLTDGKMHLIKAQEANSPGDINFTKESL
jgi:ATP-binding cassette, subfamily B, bacterial MsbA